MKTYEVKITYQGYLNVDAKDEEEAYQLAREIVLEETNYEVAKRSDYEIYELEKASN